MPTNDFMRNKRYGVEHVLSLYASSCVIVPAFAIYDNEILSPLQNTVSLCHIYLIGLLPIVDIVNVRQEHQQLLIDCNVAAKSETATFDLPGDLRMVKEDEYWRLENDVGEKFAPDDAMIVRQLRRSGVPINFDVQYIGQAYGRDGSRNAIDRLKKHETLQKISLKGVSKGYRLELLLLEVQPQTSVITVFNSQAKERDQDKDRIISGINKLYGTDERERVCLYEAALIRYFSPPFNTIFKDSFPSTDIKILADCYDKDFSGVVAEISIDGMPFDIFSATIKATSYHRAYYDLHRDSDRKLFFSGS